MKFSISFKRVDFEDGVVAGSGNTFRRYIIAIKGYRFFNL